MKLRIKILIFSCLFSSVVLGQINLVPNPSFEVHGTCPANLDEVYMAAGWSSFGGTPDYLHRCASNINVSIPVNFFGNQEPMTSGDSAYCALATLSIGPFGREMIGCQLSSPLIVGTEYYVSIVVSAAFNSNSSVECFTNNIGALFSTVQYSSSSPAPIGNYCHVNSSGIISDTVNWISINGSFIADSAYSFISIGNFYDDANTDTISCTGSYAYYYVDFVCVSTDSATCDVGVGISQFVSQPIISIYPNPVSTSLTVSANTEMEYHLIIFDAAGVTVLERDSQYNIELDMTTMGSGVYVIRLIFENGTIIHQRLIHH